MENSHTWFGLYDTIYKCSNTWTEQRMGLAEMENITINAQHE